MLVYLLFAARGFKTALVAGDGFSKLLAAGLTAVFALQVFVIVGGVTRVIPLTGVTLPFVSYGGSSIVANMVLLALLLIVSDSARKDRARIQGGLRVNRQIVQLFGLSLAAVRDARRRSPRTGACSTPRRSRTSRPTGGR